MGRLRWLGLLLSISLPGVSYLLWLVTRSRAQVGYMPTGKDPSRFVPHMVVDEYFPRLRYAIPHLLLPLLALSIALGIIYVLSEDIMDLRGIPSGRRILIRLIIIIAAIAVVLGGTWLIHSVSPHVL